MSESDIEDAEMELKAEVRKLQRQIHRLLTDPEYHVKRVIEFNEKNK